MKFTNSHGIANRWALLWTIAGLFGFITSIASASDNPIEWQTKNGAHVVFYAAPELPMLDINVAFYAGSAYDGDQFGLSTLTTALLDQGNGGFNANVFASKFADIGAQYGATNNQDMMLLTLRTLTEPETLKQATDLFKLLIAHPEFPSDAFNREKNQLLLSIHQKQESVDAIAKQAFYQKLYQQHPYAHPVEGTTASVTALTLEEVRRFYKQYLVGQNAVIILTGAIDSKTAHELAERVMQDLPNGQLASEIPKASELRSASDVAIQYPATQTAVKLGQVGITHQDPDYFALQVGNYILGGSINSRLSQEIREKRGLTYDINSSFTSMPGVGPFVIAFSTRHDQTKAVLDIARATLTSFVESGPTEAELTAAKQYLIGSFPLSMASNQSIASMQLRLAFYHLPKDFINHYIQHVQAVSIQDIKQAFQHHIDPNHLLQVTVGNS